MADTIQIKLSGRELPARLPALLGASARSGGVEADPFLPPGFLKPRSTFDISSGARRATDSAADVRLATAETEIVVLELADGSTFITSAGRLRDSLRQSRPELLTDSGEILLEKLVDGAGASRNAITQAAGSLISKVFTFVVDEGVADPIGEAVKVAG